MWERSKFDVDEEENKVHKNLSRLIHTLQHFPSKRSGLDTTSLWNLVEELESFNPDRKTKSMQFTQTTERKTYSKKYLNLRISSENEKTAFATRSGGTNHKLKKGKPEDKFNVKSSRNNCNQFKEKDFQGPKMKNAYSCGLNKGKNFSNNIVIKTNSKTLQNEEVKEKNHEKNSANRRNNFPRNNQPKFENIRPQNKNKLNSLEDPEKKMEKSVNSHDKRSNINHNSKERNYCHKLATENKVADVRDETKSNKPNRNQMVNFKCKSHQCTPKSNKALQQIILDNNQSSMDRSSVVKKLTNYWNNLLNEYEPCSSTTESSGGSCQNVQILDHVTQRAFNKSDTQSENSSSTLKSRHLSESNINIMKRVDDLHSKRFVDAEKNSRRKPLSQIKNTITHSVSVNPSDKMTNDDYIQISEDKELRDLNEIDQFLLISTTDAIEAIQNTLNTLKAFPCCNIQQFTKKILYIMVGSSILSPQHDMFLNKLEVHADKIIQEIIQMKKKINKENHSKISAMTNNLEDDIPVGHLLSALNNHLGIDMDFISKEKKGESVFKSTQIQKTSSNAKCCKVGGSISTIDEFVTDNCKIKTDSGNALALVTSRINLNKVENALNLFLMWREMMWCNRSYDYDDVIFSNHDRLPFQSFTIIYEENIIFEEESSDEDYFVHNDAENECETNIDIHRLAAATIEKYIDKVIYILENYYPDSPEVLIRMIYQALASILIWWVIVKEVFVK